MKLSDDMILAIELKNKHSELKAPVNDIMRCIKDIRETGISESQLRQMVPKIFTSSNSSYINEYRNPAEDEILINNVSDSWINMLGTYEDEHKV